MQIPRMFQSLFGKKDTTTACFVVQGMNCNSCVERVQKAVRQLPGIASVQVDLASGGVAVEHEPRKVTPEQIQQQIVAAGYAATTAQ
jgi:P-type Cu+ transporter